ncbi:MAG TPA: FkbM family methyltransferase [Thermoanaerobaculia bacterium]|jgi:FkbM family methyltransferase|nr:FkbM family methyltransferase [Thermoanaerobaculia bacterium]
MSLGEAAKRLARKALPPNALGAARRLRDALAEASPRRAWLRSRFRSWNRSTSPDEMVLRPGLSIQVDPRSREPFEWFCFRSTEMTRELDTFLAESAGAARFLDVGACHGLFALAFARAAPGRSAVAVEPSPAALEVLRANFALNPWAEIRTEAVALGAVAGSIRMATEWHHLRALADSDEGGIEISAQTLDALCADLRFVPDVIKIDVEGYEAAVLEGACETLARARPTLLLEVHPGYLAGLGRSSLEVYRLLEAAGYRPWRLSGRPLSAARFLASENVFRCVIRPVEGGGSARKARP